MCPVIGIVYSVSCRMGEKNIESFLSPEWKPHFKNTVSHLSFRILVDSRTVTIGTTKSHNTDAFIFIDISDLNLRRIKSNRHPSIFPDESNPIKMVLLRLQLQGYSFFFSLHSLKFYNWFCLFF